MTRLDWAVEQIRAARQYTCGLIDDLSPVHWFAMPGGVTHIAWQVGHLAMAEYRLTLERLRGARSDDAGLIDADFLRQFGKGSTPEPEPDRYPSPEAIRNVFDRVHAAALAELADYPDADLDLPPRKPHTLFTTRIGSLGWCARHEMIHAGQIALLRRQIGLPARW